MLFKANGQSGLCIQGLTMSTDLSLLSSQLDVWLSVRHNGLDHLVKGSVRDAHFWQISVDFQKFHFKEGMSAYTSEPSGKHNGIFLSN